MAATYDESLLATSLRDRLRLRLRDYEALTGTTVGEPLLNDEAYDGLLTFYAANLREGAAQIALAIAGIFAQRVQQFARAGGISVVWPKQVEFYERAALDFRKYGVVGASVSGASYAGAPSLPAYADDERLILADRVRV